MSTRTDQVRVQPRWKYVAQAIVLGMAITAIALLVLILAHKWGTRHDLTSTREHELSPRSREVVKSLDRDMLLVLAYDGAQVAPSRLQRTLDVINKFERGSPRFRSQLINTGSQSGLAQYDKLLLDLAQQDAPEVRKHVETTTAAANSCEQIAASIEALAGQLGEIRDAMAKQQAKAEAQVRQLWDAQAAEMRAVARNLRDGAEQAKPMLTTAQPPIPIPPVDQAQSALKKPLSDAASMTRRLDEALQRLREDVANPEQVRALARALGKDLPLLRDRTNRVLADIEGLGQVRMLLIARAIQRTQAALLIDLSGASAAGTRGVTAIDFEGMLPEVVAGAPLDLRFRAEELLAGAITALSPAPKPIVVLTHPAARRIGPDFAAFARLVDRLQLRGMEMVEWAVALDREPPASLAKAGDRPVIFVTLSDEVRTSESALAMGKLAEACRALIAAGKPVLVSVNPSPLAVNGTSDPMVEFLPPLGVVADSSRVLLEERREGGARAITSDQIVRDPMSEHPIARAITGVSTRFFWPVPLEIKAVKDVTVTRIAATPSRPSLWAEADWQQFRAVPEAQRAQIPDPPAPGGTRDLRTPTPDNGWTLAAAIERKHDQAPKGQRLVVVGSNLWFLDRVAQQQTIVDGKALFATPGNEELFLASVSWLAHQDDQIARGTTSQTAPVIPELSQTQRSWLGWSLMLIVPALILLAGVAWRLWRG